MTCFEPSFSQAVEDRQLKGFQWRCSLVRIETHQAVDEANNLWWRQLVHEEPFPRHVR